MGKRTYFIQIFDTENKKWATLYKTQEKRKIDYIKYLIKTNKDLPKIKIISKTKLIRQYGTTEAKQVEKDLLYNQINHKYKSILKILNIENNIESKETKTIDYLLRDIPEDLHSKIKEIAIKQKISIKDFIINACYKAINNEL